MAIYNENAHAQRPEPRRPESTVRKARIRAAIFMGFALFAGLAAAYVATKHLANRPAVASMAMSKVAVASMDLPLAATLRPEMVNYIDWPTSAIPPGAHLEGDSLEGRVVGRSVARGEPLVEALLASKDKGQGMAAVIPSDMRAMTVQVNEVIGVAGFIHPNDIVDVVATMQRSSTDTEYRSKIILQGVKVLAVGQDMVTEGSKPVKVPVVTLLVSPEQSERLALVSSQGKVQLTLRSQADDDKIATTGIGPTELFGSRPIERPTRAARAVPQPAKPQQEVVEVLRGDKFEERKLQHAQ